MQDVFAVLVQRMPEFTYDRDRRFRGWLWTVTRNKWRERTRRNDVRVDGDRDLTTVPGPEQVSVEQVDLRRHLMAQVLPALESQFQPSTWRAFWEHVVPDRPAPQVAAEHEMTVSAVYKAKFASWPGSTRNSPTSFPISGGRTSMSDPLQNCPRAADLRDLMSGRLPADRADEVE